MFDGHKFSLSGAQLTARASGVLWWEEQRLLCVSDLHFGKSDRLARRFGVFVPPYETADTLQRLQAEIEALDPSIIVCEYNSLFGQKKSVTVPYKSNFIRSKEHYSNLYYGASINAFIDLMKKKNYWIQNISIKIQMFALSGIEKCFGNYRANGKLNHTLVVKGRCLALGYPEGSKFMRVICKKWRIEIISD